jgi:hypothetical protein
MTNEVGDFDDGWQDELTKRFEGFGSDPSKPRKRRARERTAGLTAAQRSRRGPSTKQVNFRATDRTCELIEAIAGKLGKSQGKAIAEAVDNLAKALGIEGRHR